ncbi:hypothetical protein ACI2OX_14720 [Bacillus sp. N9]
MGYISMVPRYEYERYKLRSLHRPNIKYPIPVLSTRKLDLKSRLERSLEERIVDLNKNQRIKSKSYESQKREVSLSLAELTGKGQNFHDYA